MNIFSLFASLGINTKDFTKGLNSAEGAFRDFANFVTGASGELDTSLSANLSSGISAVGKGIDLFIAADEKIVGITDTVVSTAASIATQTASTVKSLDDTIMGTVDNVVSTVADGFMQMASAGAEFVQSFMQEGMSFDTAMGQVGATLLQTRDDMDTTTVSVEGFNGTLREFAKKLGAETMFTATQSAEALNYMALAGYDAQTSAEMLPKVLNLATAGAMDLGTASDMVTDAQTALGLSLDDTSVFIDQMAKTASSSNTSVSQLGDAILSIGATGRQVKGGFTELNTVLGVLADNGIKASESGNMLRRLLTNLTTAEGEAKEQLDKLGVSVFDTQGNMRDLPSIFLELDKAMSGLTDQERVKAISDIFGQYSLAGANALLKTSSKRWEELTEKIKDSEGAAQAMADIQLDALPGQITILQSAFSGLQTELYEKVAPMTKEFVEMLSSGLSNVTAEITEGNWGAAFTRLGSTAVKLIKKGVDTVFENATTINEFIDGIIIFVDKVSTALFEGGSKLLPQLLGHLLYFSQQIITNFSDFLSKEENIKTIEDTVSHLFEQLETFFDKNHDNLYNIFSTLFDLGIQFIDDLFLLKRETIYSILSEKLLEILEDLPETVQKWLEDEKLNEFIENIFSFIGTLVNSLINSSAKILPLLLDFALDLADKVITGIADFIADNENFEKIVATINLLLLKIENFLTEHEDELYYIFSELFDVGLGFALKIFKLKRKTTADLILKKFKEMWSEDIEGQMAVGMFGGGLGKLIVDHIDDIVALIINIFKSSLGIHSPSTVFRDEIGKPLIEGLWLGMSNAKDWLSEKISGFTDKILESFKNFDLIDVGKNSIEGFWNGINNAKDWLIEKIGGFTDSVTNAFKDFFGIQSPSKVMRDEVGKFLAEGVGVGFTKEMGKVTEDMQKALPTTFDINTDIASKSVPTQSNFGGNTFEMHIENFYNNRQDDVQKLGRALYSEIFREKVATT